MDKELNTTPRSVGAIFHKALKCIASNSFKGTDILKNKIKCLFDTVSSILDAYAPLEPNSTLKQYNIVGNICDRENLDLPHSTIRLKYNNPAFLALIPLYAALKAALTKYIVQQMPIFNKIRLNKEPLEPGRSSLKRGERYFTLPLLPTSKTPSTS